VNVNGIERHGDSYHFHCRAHDRSTTSAGLGKFGWLALK